MEDSLAKFNCLNMSLFKGAVQRLGNFRINERLLTKAQRE